MNMLISMAAGLCFFIATITAYTIGLKHGKQLSEGRVPKVKLNPVRAITEAVEQHQQKQEEKKAEEELADIFNYSTESAIKTIKKENSRV